MAEVEVTINLSERRAENAPKARLPRKLKKDIVKVAGRNAYRRIIGQMQSYYNVFGYYKFNIKRK